jgi:hypothetical protein
MADSTQNQHPNQPETLNTLFGNITLTGRYFEEGGELLVEGEGMVLSVFNKLSLFPVLRITVIKHSGDLFTVKFPQYAGHGALSPWTRIFDAIKQESH